MRSHRLVLLVSAVLSLSLVGTAGAVKPPTRYTKATTVSAVEVEWHVKLSPASVPAGPVMFMVRNAGKLSHMFIVLRTNLPAAKLPMKGSEVDLKKAGKVMGEIRNIAPGKSASVALTLKRGRYVLLCNFPAHYKSGQFAAFRVT